MLRPGTKVRIHDRWNQRSPVNRQMNRYLGQIMTICDIVTDGFYTMEEDEDGPEFQGGYWHFHERDFDVIYDIDDAGTDGFVAPTDQDFLRLFGIGGE